MRITDIREKRGDAEFHPLERSEDGKGGGTLTVFPAIVIYFGGIVGSISVLWDGGLPISPVLILPTFLTLYNNFQ